MSFSLVRGNKISLGMNIKSSERNELRLFPPKSIFETIYEISLRLCINAGPIKVNLGMFLNILNISVHEFSRDHALQ